MIKRLLILQFFFLCFLSNYSQAKGKFFAEGLNLFKKTNLKKQNLNLNKILYLIQKVKCHIFYLSKIFNNFKEKVLEEQNLHTVILLNPNNEDAIYYLAKLKLDNSDYNKKAKN